MILSWIEFSLSSTFSSAIAVVQLLLLDGVHPFAAVIHSPVGVDAVATVVRGFAFACRDVIAADDGASCTVRAVDDALADVPAQGRQEIRLAVFTSSWALSALMRFRWMVMLCSSA
mgnify:CR=1 FL=1